MRRIFFTLIILIAVFKVNAQSIPVGIPDLDDYYRRQQLLGKVDSNLSFTVRPISPRYNSEIGDIYDPDGTVKKNHWTQLGPVTFAKGLGQFQILPLTWQQQYNSNHPYGWNDGLMVPSKGYQTMISGGFYLRIGPLSVQLKPEFVYASNPAYNGFSSGHNNTDLSNYYEYHTIDQPERFGNEPYKKAFLGQSSIKLTFGPISAGLSNENLWWGPGIRNSLILSNTAPGFKHVTVNTVRPIKTYIGYFEGQVIAAHLNSSGFSSLQTANLSNGTNSFPSAAGDKRYFTGFNINYHPKWVPGLTLGLTRTFSAYLKDVKGLGGYIPFFTPYSKQATQGGIDGGIGDPFPRDQYTSFYARWLFVKGQAEVYFEYGLNDNSYNLNDFIGSPDHSRTYLFGLRKMIQLNKSNQHILFGGEITQLSQSVDRLVRWAGSWYNHYQVLEGHTNMGQVLGAGIGPGSNLQSIDISWVSGFKKLGILFERFERDVDYQEGYVAPINNNTRKWVDFAVGLQGTWNYKNLIFNARVQHIKSLNYQWVLKDYVPGQYYIPHNDVYNFHGQLGLTYRF
jgi:hypothetical protein